MARDLDDIQRDIERTRQQLAGTLDELAARTKPSNVVNGAKDKVTTKLQDPKVQKILAGVGVAVVALIGTGIYRSRKNKNDLKEIQKLLNK